MSIINDINKTYEDIQKLAPEINHAFNTKRQNNCVTLKDILDKYPEISYEKKKLDLYSSIGLNVESNLNELLHREANWINIVNIEYWLLTNNDGTKYYESSDGSDYVEIFTSRIHNEKVIRLRDEDGNYTFKNII